MLVTIELTDEVIRGIAKEQAVDRAFEWSTDPELKTIQDQYAAVFADGMKYLKKLMEDKP